MSFSWTNTHPIGLTIETRINEVSYRLLKLASGSYDVVLNGVISASLVRNGSSSDASWTAELLLELPPEEMPVPFRTPEHRFGSLEEARLWLGAPMPVSGTQAQEV